MKVLIVSDIHSNWAALRAVLLAEPNIDATICLGDLINFGPRPCECVAWAKELSPSGISVQGNHDLAVGTNADPHCSFFYAKLAAATQTFTEKLLTPESKRFLAELKPSTSFHLGEANCFACHATPKDRLYGFLPPDAVPALWEQEVALIQNPDFLFCGHTHLPMKERIGRTLIVNPGSVGLPSDGNSRAAYAVWEDSQVTLCRVAYDIEETIRAYADLALEPEIEEVLFKILRTGGHSSPVNEKVQG
jgi:putative phosphoesterase